MMHWTDNKQNRVFFERKVCGEEEDKCVRRGVGRWEEKCGGGVQAVEKKRRRMEKSEKDKTCLREPYIKLKFSAELCIKINRRIIEQDLLMKLNLLHMPENSAHPRPPRRPTHHLTEIPSKVCGAINHGSSSDGFAFVSFRSQRLIKSES